MSDDSAQKPTRHICLTRRTAMGISVDPELDIIAALADEDVMTMVRGLSKQEVRSPFPSGLFGIDAGRTEDAIRRMRDGGLISSRRDGDDHVYFLNKPRFRDLERFVDSVLGSEPGKARIRPSASSSAQRASRA